MKKILLIVSLALITLFSFNTYSVNVGVYSEVAVPLAGVQIAPVNTKRKSIVFVNTSNADTITIKLDSVPADIDDGFKLRGNQNESIILPVINSVFAISSNAGGSNIQIFEILE